MLAAGLYRFELLNSNINNRNDILKMSISLNTTTHYISVDEFVRVNPWFDDHFRSFLNSRRFSDRVEAIQAGQFQSLFDRQVMNSPAFARLLTEQRQLLQNTTDSSIARVISATDTKVAELVNDHQSFAQLRQDIANNSSVIANRFIADAKRQMQEEEAKRSDRIAKLESETQSLRSGQFLVFIGGALLGGVTALASRS